MVTVKASSLAATGGRRQVWSYPKDSLPRESFLFDLSGCSSPILKVCLYLTGLRTCSTWTAYHQCFSKTIGGNHLTSELSEMGIQAKWEYKVGYARGWPKDSKKKKKKAWERDVHRPPRKTFTYFWQSRRPHNAGLCSGERAEKPSSLISAYFETVQKGVKIKAEYIINCWNIEDRLQCTWTLWQRLRGLLGFTKISVQSLASSVETSVENFTN